MLCVPLHFHTLCVITKSNLIYYFNNLISSMFGSFLFQHSFILSFIFCDRCSSGGSRGGSEQLWLDETQGTPRANRDGEAPVSTRRCQSFPSWMLKNFTDHWLNPWMKLNGISEAFHPKVSESGLTAAPLYTGVNPCSQAATSGKPLDNAG